MIDYLRLYQFENDLAKFSLLAETFEHPTDYGNGTLLVMDTKSDPKGFSSRNSYDIRYEPVSTADDVDDIVLDLIENNYGVSRDNVIRVVRPED